MSKSKNKGKSPILLDLICILISTFGLTALITKLDGSFGTVVLVESIFFFSIKVLAMGIGDVTGLAVKPIFGVLFIFGADLLAFTVNSAAHFGVSMIAMIAVMIADIICVLLIRLILKKKSAVQKKGSDSADKKQNKYNPWYVENERDNGEASARAEALNHSLLAMAEDDSQQDEAIKMLFSEEKKDESVITMPVENEFDQDFTDEPDFTDESVFTEESLFIDEPVFTEESLFIDKPVFMDDSDFADDMMETFETESEADPEENDVDAITALEEDPMPNGNEMMLSKDENAVFFNTDADVGISDDTMHHQFFTKDDPSFAEKTLLAVDNAFEDGLVMDGSNPFLEIDPLEDEVFHSVLFEEPQSLPFEKPYQEPVKEAVVETKDNSNNEVNAKLEESMKELESLTQKMHERLDEIEKRESKLKTMEAELQERALREKVAREKEMREKLFQEQTSPEKVFQEEPLRKGRRVPRPGSKSLPSIPAFIKNGEKDFKVKDDNLVLLNAYLAKSLAIISDAVISNHSSDNDQSEIE